MKKTLLVSFLVLFAGCAFIGQQKSAYDACKADKACVDQITTISNTVAGVASTITAVIPNPAIAAASPLVGKASGVLAGIIAAIILGNGILKKKTEVPK